MAPTLPSDDPRPKMRALRLELQRRRFEYDYGHVPSLALVAKLPRSHNPRWAWWDEVLQVAKGILENVDQVRKASGAGPDPELKRRLDALKATLRDDRSGALVDEASDDGPPVAAGLVTVSAGLAQRLGVPWQKVLSDLSDKAAEGAIDGRARTLADYKRLYPVLPRQERQDGVMNDVTFGWLRVAGPNPVMLSGVTALPEDFPVTEAHFRAGARLRETEGDSLELALGQRRVYLCDYSGLSGMPAGKFPGYNKVVPAPRALFVVEPRRGRLMPLAIQHRPGGPVIAPDQGFAWSAAKLAVQVADGTTHEAVTHLARTHLLVEPFILAAERQLDREHPLYVLLRPHFEGTLFINNSAHASLIADGGTVDRLMPGTIEASREAAVSGVRSWPFNEAMLPAQLARRGVDDRRALPHYPYRDDGLLIWEAIHAWVADYVRLYYKDDEAVAADEELRAFAAELTAVDGGRVVGFGEKGGRIRTAAYLIDALTLVIFTASAQHAAVNFPQLDVMSDASSFPLSLYGAPPTGPSADEAAYIKLLPPLDQALIQLNLGTILGSVRYTRLGRYGEGTFEDERVAPLLKRFQHRLNAIEAQIDARNGERLHPYPYLKPSLIPASINI